jgi:hypothetical protein
MGVFVACSARQPRSSKEVVRLEDKLSAESYRELACPTSIILPENKALRPQRINVRHLGLPAGAEVQLCELKNLAERASVSL